MIQNCSGRSMAVKTAVIRSLVYFGATDVWDESCRRLFHILYEVIIVARLVYQYILQRGISFESETCYSSPILYQTRDSHGPRYFYTPGYQIGL